MAQPGITKWQLQYVFQRSNLSQGVKQWLELRSDSFNRYVFQRSELLPGVNVTGG